LKEGDRPFGGESGGTCGIERGKMKRNAEGPPPLGDQKTYPGGERGRKTLLINIGDSTHNRFEMIKRNPDRGKGGRKRDFPKISSACFQGGGHLMAEKQALYEAPVCPKDPYPIKKGTFPFFGLLGMQGKTSSFGLILGGRTTLFNP